jgi:hypothetical protein
MVESIIINGNKYEINGDVLMDVVERYQDNPEDSGLRREFTDDVLIPKITDEDYKTIRITKMFEITEKLLKMQKELETEFKKKLSLL